MQYGVFEHCMNVASVYNDCFALHRSLSLTARCWPFRLHAAWLDVHIVGRDVIRDLPFTYAPVYMHMMRELHKAPTAS
jgi:hypothetical protein